MALIMNGTTISTTLANMLNYNGTNIVKVIFNGITVWLQHIFYRTWTGQSIITTYSGTWGLQTSGASMHWHNSFSDAGAWISVDSNGVFANTSSIDGNMGLVIQADRRSFKYMHTNVQSAGVVRFTVAGGWTGTAKTGGYGMTTSLGRIRFESGTDLGPWATLS